MRQQLRQFSAVVTTADSDSRSAPTGRDESIESVSSPFNVVTEDHQVERVTNPVTRSRPNWPFGLRPAIRSPRNPQCRLCEAEIAHRG